MRYEREIIPARYIIQDNGYPSIVLIAAGVGSVADPVPGAFFEPKIRDEINPDSGSGMNIPAFLRTWCKFFGLKIDTDPGSFNPGFGIEKSRSGIRDKHPGPATLGVCIDY